MSHYDETGLCGPVGGPHCYLFLRTTHGTLATSLRSAARSPLTLTAAKQKRTEKMMILRQFVPRAEHTHSRITTLSCMTSMNDIQAFVQAFHTFHGLGWNEMIERLLELYKM